jgi:hypothetical protein
MGLHDSSLIFHQMSDVQLLNNCLTLRVLHHPNIGFWDENRKAHYSIHKITLLYIIILSH